MERIGPSAYKLDLPREISIHPVFHISQLNQVLGQHHEVQPLVPHLFESHEWIIEPAEVFGYRRKSFYECVGSTCGMERVVEP